MKFFAAAMCGPDVELLPAWRRHLHTVGQDASFGRPQTFRDQWSKGGIVKFGPHMHCSSTRTAHFLLPSCPCFVARDTGMSLDSAADASFSAEEVAAFSQAAGECRKLIEAHQARLC